MSVNSATPPTNIFSGPHVDRVAHRRKDPRLLTAALDNSHTRFVPVWRSRNLLETGDPPRARFWSRAQASNWLDRHEELVYLGEFGGASCVALELDPTREAPPGDGQFEDLHRMGALLPADEAALLAYARGMLSWHRRHMHCGRCGSATRVAQAGHVRLCTNAQCGLQQFPRVDPAVIVLVTHGEQCLLGRQARWPKGRYSTIAGFVEPGESLEDAVTREVFEEAGERVAAVRYPSSQPWPFRTSLMLGFTAAATTTEITLTDNELEDARWFSREQVRSGSLKLPNRVSIAYQLVEHWYTADGSPPLEPDV